CLLGDLAVDATATITIVGVVDSDVAAGALANTARVASANTESNTGNNEANVSTNVTVDDGLGISKMAPATIAPNQAIAYQIVVSNTGPSAATNVVVSD